MDTLIKYLNNVSFLTEEIKSELELEAKVYNELLGIQFEIIHSDSIYLEVLIICPKSTIGKDDFDKVSLKNLGTSMFNAHIKGKVIHIVTSII